MKVLILSLLVALSSCQFKFLEKADLKVTAAPGEIVLTPDCQAGLPFIHKKEKATPNVIEKGGSINLKAAVQSDQPLHVAGLTIVCYLNGTEAYNQKKDLNDDVEAGEMYIYTIDAGIPSFVPSGSFDIQVKLVDKDGNPLSCLAAHFDF